MAAIRNQLRRIRAWSRSKSDWTGPKPQKPSGPQCDANYRLGNRVLAELLGGLIGGGLFGWLIDRFADTSPWGLLVMLFLGIVVAFRNIIRLTSTPRK
jgi:ATP synthase protein I